jgi:hypothetical protein
MGGERNFMNEELETINDFKPVQSAISGNQLMAAEAMKQVAEVQAAVLMAKQYPRDRFTAVNNIIEDCGRRSLAEGAVYAYPRGTSTVSGPSIRLAEVLAREWGNLDCGIKELSRDSEKSLCMAFAWDLEKNTRFTRTFEVPHIRFTKTGQYKLTDPRDIYENVANNGARRLRACILEAIPGDVTEKAVLACKKTITSNSGKPLVDRIQDVILGFSKFSVTKEHIEKRLKHSADTINEEELFDLITIGNSIKDNTAKRGDFFDILDSEPTEKTSALKDKLEKTKKPEMTKEESDKLNKELDAQAAKEAGQ